MKTIVILLFLFISFRISGQEYPFWGDLEPGNYQVGVFDTVIYNNNQLYTFIDYQALKPYFVSIWYPMNEGRKSASMHYTDYFKFHIPEPLKSLGDSLVRMQQTSFINYGIKNRLDAWDDRDFGKSEQKLFDKILNTNINATLSNQLPDKKYPIILYHHGMGGTKEENSILFEYLASQGFVIVSSNYHWPDQSTALSDLKGDLKFVTDFTSALPFVDVNRMYFLAHSWGAQIGLLINQEGDHPFKSFILLDNTLEQLSLDQVSRYYPDLDSVFRHHPNDFRTKTYIITSQKSYQENGILVLNPEPGFEAFRLLNLQNFEFLVAKETLSHEAFTSTGVVRSIYSDEISQDDSTSVNSQYRTYLELNRQLLQLLNDDQFDPTNFFTEIDLSKAPNKRE